MGTRRLKPEDWAPVIPTRVTIRKAPEPREERLRIPSQRSRPSPINLTTGDPYSTLAAPWSQRSNEELCEPPQDPEIVDLGGPTWTRHGSQSVRRVPSPSAVSQYSFAPSDMSFGILDYYLRDNQSLPSPKLPATPRIDTPVIDPAMKRFKFELTPPRSVSPLSTVTKVARGDVVQDAKTGAERPSIDLLDLSPFCHTSQNERKDTYRLFPKVKDVTPPRKWAGDQLESQSPHYETQRDTLRTVPSHQQPDASYRPRKESISSSVQSRKDSFTSFSGTRRIPMRVLTSGATPTPKTRSNASTASPPQQSRWSDDTVTSPGVLATPGPRASFGPLLERDGTQYPACFFEDDDDDSVSCEVAPLRRKLRWHRSSNSTREVKSRKSERFDGERSIGRWLATALLCGCFK